MQDSGNSLSLRRHGALLHVGNTKSFDSQSRLVESGILVHVVGCALHFASFDAVHSFSSQIVVVSASQNLAPYALAMSSSRFWHET